MDALEDLFNKVIKERGYNNQVLNQEEKSKSKKPT